MTGNGIEESLKLVHKFVDFFVGISFKIDKIIFNSDWCLLHRHFVLGQVLDNTGEKISILGAKMQLSNEVANLSLLRDSHEASIDVLLIITHLQDQIASLLRQMLLEFLHMVELMQTLHGLRFLHHLLSDVVNGWRQVRTGEVSKVRGRLRNLSKSLDIWMLLSGSLCIGLK
jgi:hypothetical protein